MTISIPLESGRLDPSRANLDFIQDRSTSIRLTGCHVASDKDDTRIGRAENLD